MDVVLEWLSRVGFALLQLLLSPFYWLSIILIAIHYRRQMLLERRLFAVKMHSWVQQTWRAWLGGLVAGVFVSAAAIGLGVALSPPVVFLIWGISILLLVFRVRMLCLAYSGGIVALLHVILGWFPDFTPNGVIGTVVQELRAINPAGLLILIALLHAAEAFLVRKQAASFASPLFMESKRGSVMGGYRMQTMWPVPLLIFMPSATYAGEVLPWQPLLNGDLWQLGWMLMAFPVMIGFSEVTYAYLPQEKANVTSSRLFMYAAALLALSLLANWWSPLVAIAGIVSIGLHEWMIWWSRQLESNRSPLYTHSGEGLRVQAVLPGSPAEEMGIEAGERITKINGRPLRTKADLHQALSSSAMYKLEVYNLNGEVKFVQRALYDNEHYQLGVLLAPDDDVAYVADVVPVSAWRWLKAPWKRHAAGEHRVRTEADS
ncbi:PDZ domain-containing protein [Paenibacillus sp. 1001270B_150601_E10]|uniref:PDZ domain-containing protein n=1 Tax=Paenibacillus sp. 1001270B_150601_E10 TaxID=2787079 RepID=UPI002B4BF7A1|nr:PDZ domain-containing protein [Paenibacillus sp. 1001270B_150601_E10]